MDLIERAHQVGDVEILRPEQRREAAVHRRHVSCNRPVCGDAAQRALPGMHVPIDQARQDDHVGGVDHPRAVRRRQRGRDCGNGFVLDQHVAARKVGDAAIHGEDATALDQNPAHPGSLTPALAQSRLGKTLRYPR